MKKIKKFYICFLNLKYLFTFTHSQQPMKATKENNYLYNPNLCSKARELRNFGTKSEAYLWKFVLRKKIMGYSFLRQRPILNYIADFMCPELLLIIEADGLRHYDERIQIKDSIRQKALEDAGFRVLRFEDNIITSNISYVTTIVEQTICEILEVHPPPPK